MAEAKQGDEVKVHYTGKLDDGTVFDSSQGRDPIGFTVGSGEVIPGFEEAVVGMEVGDKKTIKIESENAYGPRREDMVVTVDRDKFPEDVEPEEGQRFQVGSEQGQAIPAVVTDVTGDKITLDANSPLAGKDLTFEIELVEVS
jgi:FKBP-type peptidyl-prolyl cis-trans isomerase 2